MMPMAKRHGVEQLSHGGQDGFDRDVGHLRLDIVGKSIHGPIHGQAVDGNADGQKYQYRHHKFADLFDPFFNAQKDDNSSECQERSGTSPEVQMWYLQSR